MANRLTPSEMIDAEFAYLELRVAQLELENTELRRENGELLGKLVAAQDLAYMRMVRSLLESPDDTLRRMRHEGGSTDD